MHIAVYCTSVQHYNVCSTPTWTYFNSIMLCYDNSKDRNS